MSALICSCGTSLAGVALNREFENQQSRYDRELHKIDEKFERNNDEALKKHGTDKDMLDEAIGNNFKQRKHNIKQLNIDHQKRMSTMYIEHGIDNWCCKQRLQTKVSPLDTHVP